MQLLGGSSLPARRRRSAERKALERYVAKVFGRYRVVREITRPHGNSCVLHLVDGAGMSWIAKRHVRARAFRREVRAYKLWTPALGDHAAALHRFDEEEHSLILNAVPGRSSTGRTAHRQAGAILRRLHDADPGGPGRTYAEACMARLNQLLDRGAGLFDTRETGFARSEIRGLKGLPIPRYVPCHLDYTPSNWLVDASGTLRVVDFAGARRQPWVRDLNRLYFGEWWTVPDYGDAFMDGYGRALTADDLELLRRTGVLTAVSRVLWGAEHGLPRPTADGRRILHALMSGRR